MQWLKKMLPGLVILVLIHACKQDPNEDLTESLRAPEMQSSNPENGATGCDINTKTAEFIFDVDIILILSSRVTINGEIVPGAKSSGKTLTIDLPALKGDTKYVIVLQPKAIKALTGLVNSEPVSISFTTGPKPEVTISPVLAMKNPSAEAVRVYNFLRTNYGKKVISGAMANVNWNINEAEWVKLHTGKYPAMATFDYIHSIESPANWIDYSNTSVLENWWNNNGLIAIGWHWRVPVSQGATKYAFYTSETNFKASNATIEGTWENQLINADLEKIAGYLKLLQAKNIPVIWRPLHEAAGNIFEYTNGTAWFWWGADGADAFRQLWVYMFKFFESKGLNNLIWVWTTQTKDRSFYPGNEYVDIIGRDLYDKTDVAAIAAEFKLIQDNYPDKMVTLSECGNIAVFSQQWNQGVAWSYFMPWYDFERTNRPDEADFKIQEHKYANITWWKDAFGVDAVITRDEMPDLK